MKNWFDTESRDFWEDLEDLREYVEDYTDLEIMDEEDIRNYYIMLQEKKEGAQYFDAPKVYRPRII